MTKEILADVYRAIRNIPAWLTKATETFGLSDEDQFFMADLHADFTAENRKHQKRPYALPEVDHAWAAQRRREYLTDRIASLRTRLGQEKIDSARVIRDGGKDMEFSLAMNNDRMAYLNAEIAKANRELEFCADNGEMGGSGLTHHMIEKARQYDIRKLVEAEHGRITCPLHNGDPKSKTMSVVKGFGKCFQCSRRLDSIGWLMTVKQMDFVSAVKALQ